MAGFEIRRAVPEEGAALCALLDAAYQPYRDAGVSLPDVTDGLDDEIAAGRVWVAVQGATLLGMLNLSWTFRHGHLMNVAVSPKAKGEGVGGGLIRHAIALAEGAGCRTLDLATHRNMAENISLYQHLGWEITSREGSRVMMRLMLDRGD